jgi:uncharacterized protein (DUF433 family)
MATDPSMMSTATPPIHIDQTPGVCGGRARIAGSRIRVQDIVVWYERLGLSADEIVSRFPQLAVAEVYAALTYYHDHRAEIDSQMDSGKKLVDEMRRLHPSKLPAELQADK